MRSAGGLLVAAAIAGCAPTLGDPNPGLLQRMASSGEFGAPQRVRLCARQEGILSLADIQRLLDDAWNRTEAGALGLRMEVVALDRWQRDGEDMQAVFDHLQAQPIAEECDRTLTFVARNESLNSELAGGVALTHGFILLAARSGAPAESRVVEVLRHELYHLAGCGHADSMDECYRRIARAKTQRKGRDGFFPVYQYLLDEDIRRNCGVNPLIADREEANRIAVRWAAEKALGVAITPPPC